jgi:hypothetical protein
MPATVDARQPILPTASSSNLTDKHCHISANFSTAYITEWLPAVISRSGLCFVRVGFVYGCFWVGMASFIGSLLRLYVYYPEARTPAVIDRSGLCFVRVGFVYGIFDLDVTAFIDHLLLSSISRLEGSSDVP